MTVQTNNNSISYVGNGSTVHFDYDYLILNASHLKVYFGDVLQTSGYVVSGVSSQTGGTVAFAVAPPNGANITLIRDVPFLQLTDYQPYDAFPAESHERALDLLTMMTQQLKDELGRTMQHPVGGNKWDAKGNEIINVGTGSSGTSAANIDQVKYLISSEVGDDPSASASVRSREALRRSYAEAGYNLVVGSFEVGGTLVNANDVLLQERTGKVFSGPAGAVAAGTNPASGGFVDVSLTSFAACSTQSILAGMYGVGSILTVVDRGSARFLVERGASPNGYTTLDAGNGNIASIVPDNGCVTLEGVGADNTGASDVIPALEAATALGYKVRQSGGTYLIGSNFNMPSGLDIELYDGAEFVRKSDVRFTAGLASARTTLAGVGNFTIGSNLITVSASSYAAVDVGDYLYIKNKLPDNPDYILDFVAKPNDLNDWVYQVQTPKVIAKLASNTLLVSEQAILTYDLTWSGAVEKMTDTRENVRIKAKFRNEIGSKLTSEGAVINASAMFGIDLSGSEFRLNGESGGVYINVGRVESVAKTKFFDGAYLDLFLRQACSGSNVSNARHYGHRTNDACLFIEAHNRNIVVALNQYTGAVWDNTTPLLSAIQMDAKVNNCTIYGNAVYGHPCGMRMELGCFNNTVTGNTFQLCEVSGMRMISTRNNRVNSNTFLDCGLSDLTNVVLSQQKGGIYVNSVIEENFDRNTFTWTSPAFTGVSAALSGSMRRSSFCGNTVKQARRAVWLLNPSSDNKINDNPVMDVIGGECVVISGNQSHYNEVCRNNGYGPNKVGAIFAQITDGSEGNKILDNSADNFAFAVSLQGASKYQSIKGNHGDHTRSINDPISAPVMPSNATAKRGFEVHSVAFDQLQECGASTWQFKQNVPGVGNRWVKMAMTVTNVDI